MILCEAAAYYKDRGINLIDQMDNIRKKYGYFMEDVMAMTFKGLSGIEKMNEIMADFRNNVPTEFAGYKVLKVRDYLAETITDIETKEVKPSGLPKSNVLYYELTDDAWFAIRPSGTEPKIKFYFGIKGSNKEDAYKKLEDLKNDPKFRVE